MRKECVVTLASHCHVNTFKLPARFRKHEAKPPDLSRVPTGPQERQQISGIDPFPPPLTLVASATDCGGRAQAFDFGAGSFPSTVCQPDLGASDRYDRPRAEAALRPAWPMGASPGQAPWVIIAFASGGQRLRSHRCFTQCPSRSLRVTPWSPRRLAFRPTGSRRPSRAAGRQEGRRQIRVSLRACVATSTSCRSPG
jgi:hypothetical protein